MNPLTRLWRAALAAGPAACLGAALGGCQTPPAYAERPGPIPGSSARRLVAPPGDLEGAPEVLVVVAHPDDELQFTGLLYKLSQHLGGAADVALITNGEGGFKYATLAESIYGLPLTEEAVGRAELPAIRADEISAGCTLLGVRDLFFLGEKDHRYTQDVGEILGDGADVWDLDRVRTALHALLDARPYAFVLVLAPTPTTHGHHQAASLLALEVLAARPEATRPIALCTRLATADSPQPEPPELRPDFPLTALRQGVPPLVFDRTQPFGHRGRLDYTIVANWAIAAHRSQGTMQRLMGRGLSEHYFVFGISPPGAAERAQALFARLAEPQFAGRSYGASAGTNAGTGPSGDIGRR